MNTQRTIILTIIILILGGIYAFSILNNRNDIQQNLQNEEASVEENEVVRSDQVENGFSKFGLKTNTANRSMDLSFVLSGGPGKDGIPAINDPKFDSISESKVSDDTSGILVDIDGAQKFYPYSILVWHEIVNDNIGDTEFSATFCPLCGTGIVYNREVLGETLEFGVSGLLFESNLLMFDRKTESLWVQARGEAVVGDFLGEELEILPMQLITFEEVKEKYSKAQILSEDTGYRRDYSRAPYSGYSDTEQLYFPVSVSDKRLPAKELMQVTPVGDISIAFKRNDLEDGEVIKQTVKDDINSLEVEISRDGGEIVVRIDGEEKPGYVEMWFSWATHHQDDGVLLEI